MSDYPKTYTNSEGGTVVVTMPFPSSPHNGLLGDFFLGYFEHPLSGRTDLIIEPAALERYGYEQVTP